MTQLLDTHIASVDVYFLEQETKSRNNFLRTFSTAHGAGGFGKTCGIDRIFSHKMALCRRSKKREHVGTAVNIGQIWTYL